MLFDQGTPAPLRRHLPGHSVDTAFERGWSDLRNGDLLDRAEAAGFDLLITTDQHLRYEQELSGRRLGVLVLLTTSWPRIRRRVEEVASAAARMKPGDYEEVNIL
ncbi:MAG: hypothetical protein OXG81_13990 [Acidobacteria bacterium]|nr:hypothetical protein [Acidobacteriota bacterium]